MHTESQVVQTRALSTLLNPKLQIRPKKKIPLIRIKVSILIFYADHLCIGDFCFDDGF